MILINLELHQSIFTFDHWTSLVGGLESIQIDLVAGTIRTKVDASHPNKTIGDIHSLEISGHCEILVGRKINESTQLGNIEFIFGYPIFAEVALKNWQSQP